MALEDITKKILAEAEEKAQDILTQARQTAERIQKEAEARAGNLTHEIIQAKQICGQQEALRIVSLARLEAKKAILLAKQRLLNRAFAHQQVIGSVKAKKEIVLPEQNRQEELDPKTYLELLRRGYEAKVAEILFNEHIT